MASTSGTLNLFMNGSPVPDDSSCPILDPDAAIQISDELITIYQDRIDALINQLGKYVWIEFTPTKSPCTNCYYDTIRKRSNGVYRPGGPRPFERGRRCPYCKGRGFLETAATECIHALLKWNPHDAEDFGISVADHKGIVRIKTYLTHAPSLTRAETAIVNYDIRNVMQLRVRKVKGPIPVGLREDRYCISYWELL